MVTSAKDMDWKKQNDMHSFFTWLNTTQNAWRPRQNSIFEPPHEPIAFFSAPVHFSPLFFSLILFAHTNLIQLYFQETCPHQNVFFSIYVVRWLQYWPTLVPWRQHVNQHCDQWENASSNSGRSVSHIHHQPKDNSYGGLIKFEKYLSNSQTKWVHLESTQYQITINNLKCPFSNISLHCINNCSVRLREKQQLHSHNTVDRRFNNVL